jgi:alkylation response protein AidB-like acyl-CoA dehydrogenase
MTTLSNERIAVETGIFGFTAAEVLGWFGAAALDPVRRDELIQAYSAVWVAQQTAARVNAALLRGAPPGPAASGVKLRNAAAVRRLVDVAMGIRGADALLDDSFWSALVLSVPSLGIRGGAEQIQKNIIAERVLGLPKEPR